jgi:hypothetical protein
MKTTLGAHTLRYAMAVAGLALTLAPNSLALSWDNLLEARTVEKGATAAEASFHFVNRGAFPVTITSVETSCRCTTAEATRSVLQPGESGEIRVRMDVAARSGTLEKTITVTSSDAPAAPTVLAFSVTIHSALEVSPRLLTWGIGDAPAQKTAEVAVDSAGGAAPPTLSAPAGLTAALVPGSAPGRFELRVRPERTDGPLVAEVVVSFRPARGPREEASVYVQVR